MSSEDNTARRMRPAGQILGMVEEGENGTWARTLEADGNLDSRVRGDEREHTLGLATGNGHRAGS